MREQVLKQALTASDARPLQTLRMIKCGIDDETAGKSNAQHEEDEDNDHRSLATDLPTTSAHSTASEPVHMPRADVGSLRRAQGCWPGI